MIDRLLNRGGHAPGIMLLVSIITAGLALLAGCNEQKKAPPPQIPTVNVSQPIMHNVVDWDDYIGTLQSPNSVDLSARVSGLVIKADFVEGALVHKGQELYLIDPRPFQADLDTKIATVAQTAALADQAKTHFQRYAGIFKSNSQAVSEDDYDAAKAAYAQAEAQLQSAQAGEESAQLNLDWTKVTSPITGRVSYKYITVGNLVNGGSGQPTLLTRIVSIDPIYGYIQVPELAFLKYKDLQHFQQQQAGGRVAAGLACYFQIEGEESFSHAGHVDFIDNQINSATGTIALRGVFENLDGKLVPGTFGRMRIPESGQYQAILIPDAAIGASQNERFLLIVGDDGVVQQRPVELGRLFGTLRSITSGLKAGERVIVSGLQLARPGGKVNVQDVAIPAESIKALDDLEKTSAIVPATQELPATSPGGAPSATPVKQNGSPADTDQPQNSGPASNQPSVPNGSGPMQGARPQKLQVVPHPESAQ